VYKLMFTEQVLWLGWL